MAKFNTSFSFGANAKKAKGKKTAPRSKKGKSKSGKKRDWSGYQFGS